MAATVVAPPVQAAETPEDLLAVEDATPHRHIAGLAPGDSVSWAVTLRNVSTRPLDVEIGLDAPDAPVAALDTRSGLSLAVDRCSRRWAEVPDVATAAPTYHCAGESTPVSSGAAALVPMSPGETMSLRAVATLSPDAPNSLQGRRLGRLRLLATATTGDAAQSEVLSGVEDRTSPPTRRSVRAPFAFTGGAPTPLVVLGSAAIVIGAALLAAARRRRSEPRHG